MKRIYFLLILILNIFLPSCLFAQEELLAWLNLPLGSLPPLGAYSFSYYNPENVKEQDTDLRLIQHNAYGLIPLMNKNDKDLGILGMFEMKDINTEAVLPDTDIALPNRLYSVSVGPAYRQQFSNGWIWGIAGLIGSASDKLFHSEKEMFVRFDTFVKVPAKDNNAWIFLIDYNTNREYLRNWPIPGAAYYYNPSDRLEAILGLPVAYIKYNPFSNFTLTASYIMVTTIHARISYDITKSLYIYGDFSWNDELYARADRENNKDRLFYYEKLLSAGIHYQPFKYFGIDLSGGYSFDKFFYEGESYNERSEDNIDVKNGPFVQIRAGVPF